MSRHVVPDLAEYALGTLPEDDRRRIARHLERCARCAAHASAYADVTAALAALVPQVAPSPQIRARLLTAAEGSGRLARFADGLAEFFSVARDKAIALLDAVDDDEAWEPSLFPGMATIHVSAGAALAGSEASLVKLPAGLQWPLHRHVGEERHLFLRGGIADSRTGREYHPGDILVSPPGSQHSFRVLPDTDCVTAVVLFGGVEGVSDT